MVIMRKLQGLLLAMMLVCSAGAYGQDYVLDVWDGAPAIGGAAGDTARVYVYLPRATSPTRAIVLCPGGGYDHLAFDNEGTDWATYYNTMGIAAIVLQYRMPHGNRMVPISDAQEAIRLVRRHAAEWNINPDDVGIMGSSAGGHLASTVATQSTDDAMPNFQILFYPVISMELGTTHRGSHDNLLGVDATDEDVAAYCSDRNVTASTPRAIIFLSNDDGAVPPENGVSYYLALHAQGIPAALNIYPTGGHGWGMRSTFAYHDTMLSTLRAWLTSF